MNDNFLKDEGWLVLKTPQEGIRTLEILVRDQAGALSRKNSRIESLFIPQTSQPPVGEDKKVPSSITGKKSVDMKASVEFSWMESLLSIMKANVDAKANVKNSSTINFSFNNAVVNEVDELTLDEYIQDAVLNEKVRTIAEYLANDDVYIITAIMKSNSFSIELNKSGGARAEVNVNVADKAKAGGSFDVNSGRDAIMKWDGEVPLVFAVKAVQLQYNKPKWFSKKEAGYTLKNADTSLVVRGDEDLPVKRLTSSNEIIDF